MSLSPFLLCSTLPKRMLGASPKGTGMILTRCVRCFYRVPCSAVQNFVHTISLDSFFNSAHFEPLLIQLGHASLCRCGSNTYLLDDRPPDFSTYTPDQQLRYCAFCHGSLRYKDFSVFFDHYEKDFRLSLNNKVQHTKKTELSGEVGQEPECKCDRRLLGFGVHSMECKYPAWNQKRLKLKAEKLAALTNY